jgi:hypothetical protein
MPGMGDIERGLRAVSPNFAVLDSSRSDVAMLVAAMVQDRKVP